MKSVSLTESAMDPLVHSRSEVQPLLSPVVAPTLRERFAQTNIVPRHLCLPSRAAVLILFWSAIVGTAFTLAMDSTVAAGVALNVDKHFNSIVINVLIPYLCLALAMLLYPLSGFMADVCCGRYKSVIISLCILACSLACFTISCTTMMFSKANIINAHSVGHKVGLCGVFVIAFLLFFVGLSGFQANFIQLGLDQLLEAPSEYLGLFVHWATWAGSVAAPFCHILFAVYACSQNDNLLYGLLSLPPALFLLFLLILIFSCCKRRWFYMEPGQNNPYKMVFSVLLYAKKHKYPVRRSAFTYQGGERPTRIDFAKERYGGPFQTEQVEDVKTFFRILSVLLVLGPIHILEVPTSYFIFPLYTLHTGSGPKFVSNKCTAQWLALESGTLGYLFSVVAFPVYIWLIYSFFRRCIPRTFYRLFLGGCLLFFTVVFMLLSDLVGHTRFSKHNNESSNAGANYCMFRLNVSSDSVKESLNLPWEVHLIPNFLIIFSTTLITTTAFEFISAQSPHSMKGLIVGMFFTIKGFFQLLSAFLLLPFSIPSYWTEKSPYKVNCGFGYLFILCGLALIGLVLFVLVANRYQYRERDDPPYNQMAVEEAFARAIDQNAEQAHSPRDRNIQYTNSFLGLQ